MYIIELFLKIKDDIKNGKFKKQPKKVVVSTRKSFFEQKK